jgi:hypothetical protein
MKSNAQTPLFFSRIRPSASQPAQSQSPYLKAILTGKVMAARNDRDYSDRAAASRYIKESRQSNKY